MQTSWSTLVETLVPPGWQPDGDESPNVGSSWLARLLWLAAGVGVLTMMVVGFAVYLLVGGTVGPGAPPNDF